ncbi:MAG: hypothetical protein ACJAWK_001487 [Candidatus Azotimanducaceae bacterium]
MARDNMLVSLKISHDESRLWLNIVGFTQQ